MTPVMNSGAPPPASVTPTPAAPAHQPRQRRRLHTAHDTRQRRKKFVGYGLLIGSFFLMVSALMGEHGYFAELRNRREYDRLSRDVDQLRQENAQFADRIRQIQESPAALEEEARRVLGLTRPDETVIIIRPAERPGAPRPAR
jgi:cell division protein FtsB